MQALREQDLTAITDSGEPIRHGPGEVVALAQPNTAATSFYLVTAGEVMLLPASLQIPAGTAQLDVAKVCRTGAVSAHNVALPLQPLQKAFQQAP